MRETDLSACVRQALDDYFRDLDGEPPHAVYDMLISCVEKPMLESIMHRTSGNQSKAAEILGLNRNTLRKKLKQHNIQ
ncbi:Fis family transcriptional regulator, factor for inversion stimulation protein [Novimethylophilus kurashikiensis]|jgi:Fis family transcriptional regulator|uniref:Putative Fis-like DNA-binding protein n=1 Tax=Novimethylophilus kurashikiensis TaxID=1825523 RepID=A0A2R5F6J3_9PROT|nr:Fis family transcriptional regulator [Novimethylophilus kurashikiensis]GBG13188.1 Fis family transcriptional regulator, factor for inversion stimulation protein [Novimethylophilus kurashikiensis]